MRSSSYGMLADLVGKILIDSKYSELPSLSPELAADLTALSGLAGILGVADIPSVGRSWFEFILHLLMAAGIMMLEAAVLVSAWAA